MHCLISHDLKVQIKYSIAVSYIGHSFSSITILLKHDVNYTFKETIWGNKFKLLSFKAISKRHWKNCAFHCESFP